jgi:hypothetical protein
LEKTQSSKQLFDLTWVLVIPEIKASARGYIGKGDSSYKEGFPQSLLEGRPEDQESCRRNQGSPKEVEAQNFFEDGFGKKCQAC